MQAMAHACSCLLICMQHYSHRNTGVAMEVVQWHLLRSRPWAASTRRAPHSAMGRSSEEARPSCTCLMTVKSTYMHNTMSSLENRADERAWLQWTAVRSLKTQPSTPRLSARLSRLHSTDSKNRPAFVSSCAVDCMYHRCCSVAIDTAVACMQNKCQVPGAMNVQYLTCLAHVANAVQDELAPAERGAAKGLQLATQGVDQERAHD